MKSMSGKKKKKIHAYTEQMTVSCASSPSVHNASGLKNGSKQPHCTPPGKFKSKPHNQSLSKPLGAKTELSVNSVKRNPNKCEQIDLENDYFVIDLGCDIDSAAPQPLQEITIVESPATKQVMIEVHVDYTVLSKLLFIMIL